MSRLLCFALRLAGTAMLDFWAKIFYLAKTNKKVNTPAVRQTKNKHFVGTYSDKPENQFFLLLLS
jgi:hypothetical protein